MSDKRNVISKEQVLEIVQRHWLDLMEDYEYNLKDDFDSTLGFKRLGCNSMDIVEIGHKVHKRVPKTTFFTCKLAQKWVFFNYQFNKLVKYD